MADHSKPVLASTYTNVLSELDSRLDDLALWLDSVDTTPTNLPTNAKRWNSSAFKWEKWSGTAWSDMATTYGISISGNAGTVTNGLYSTGSYADPTWLTSLAGSKISGNIAGNAGTATKLATARNINGVAFDGSAAVSVNLNNNLTFNNSGSGASSGVNFSGSAATTISYNTIGAPSTTGAGASGTWGISISGNAATATSAATASYATSAGSATTATTATTANNGGVTSVNGLTGAVTIAPPDVLYSGEYATNTTHDLTVPNSRPLLVTMFYSGGQGGNTTVYGQFQWGFSGTFTGSRVFVNAHVNYEVTFTPSLTIALSPTSTTLSLRINTSNLDGGYGNPATMRVTVVQL